MPRLPLFQTNAGAVLPGQGTCHVRALATSGHKTGTGRRRRIECHFGGLARPHVEVVGQRHLVAGISCSEQFVRQIRDDRSRIAHGDLGQNDRGACHLEPCRQRGELRAIGATTLNEYQKYFEKDKALERRFQKVMIDEPSVEDAVSILRGLKDRYETYHHVRIKDEAIIAAVELSHRYIADRFLPDKAIDLIDESAAKLRLEMNSMPEELDILERQIRQLEIEREAIKRENDENKVKDLSETIAELSEKRNAMKAKWQSEKTIVDRISAEKENIETLKSDAERAERNGDYAKVAEIRYGKIKLAEQKLLDF